MIKAPQLFKVELIPLIDVVGRCKASFNLRSLGESEEVHQVHDTWDLQILGSGQALVNKDGEKRLVALSNMVFCTTLDHGQPWSGKSYDGWGLQKRGTLAIKRGESMVCLHTGKGFGRLITLELTLTSPVVLVLFKGLRGYAQECQEFTQFLHRSCGLIPLEGGVGLGSLLVQRASVQNLNQVKQVATIDPRDPLELKNFMQAGFAKAMAQVPGILSDADPECLHEYRVKLRALRSYMGLFKPVLSELSLDAKANLAGLMAPTNDLRDLDVFLENQGQYRDALGTGHDGGWKSFVTFLKTTRTKKHQDVVQWFGSPLWQDLQARTLGLLGDQSPLWYGLSNILSLPHFTVKRFLKVQEKIYSLGQSITLESPPEDLHRMRILYKRLRYTLDFLAMYDPLGPATALLPHLKLLQKRLGNYNDGTVQATYLVDLQSAHGKSLSQEAKASILELSRSTETGLIRLKELAVEQIASPLPEDLCLALHTWSLEVGL